ncbi:MAG: PilZ domain-containing protein [Terriglobales bacterium]
MSLATRDENRRLYRRLACGGEARISLLPEDGALYFGALRDLSRGGICIDMPCPLEVGSRAELLVRINGLTFRTVGQVANKERLRTGMEFIHLTAGGREMLEEFLVDLEAAQKAMAKLRMGRVESEPALSRQLMAAGIHPVVLNSRIPLLSGSADGSVEPSANERMIETVEAVVLVDIRVDVFG